MNDAIQPQPGILDIALYQGGKGHVAGIANAVKLSSNENPFGVSDRARDVFMRSAHSLNRYPSTDHAALRAAIADVHGLDADRVICGAGSGEVLMSLCQAYAGPKDEVVYTEHSFLMYPIYTKSVGATAVEVAERERTVDVDAVLAACNRRTKIVFIANPANPTGTMISAAEVEHLADKLPPQALLVLDGAYAEYVEGYDAGLGIIEARDNVVMTRTFSKIYGLGGLRVGWGYGPKHVIDVLNRIRGPFNLSTTQQDVAEAAVQDRDWVNRCRSENARQRTWLASALAELGVPSDTSMANFILARFSSPDEAQACDAFLQSKGLIVRSVAGYKLPHCLRITIGDESSCRRVAHAVAQFKGAK